ncbi:MAG: type III secretion system inner membrane ring subunit SctD [Prosthecobacter sp.]
MSSTPRKQWLLKVISGPHQGAEMALTAGKTLIGSDDQCDIVLHDVLVAPQHVEIELADSGMTAAPLGGRVFIAGKRVRDARQKVADFSFVSIGGSHLIIGPATGIWPLLSGADVPELEKEGEPQPEAPPAEGAQEDPVVTAAPASPARRHAPSRLAPMLGITAGVVLLLGWAYVYYDLKVDHQPPAVSHVSKPVERAQAILEDMGVVGSIKIEDASGRLMATGYVDTESKQRELQAAFREEVPGMRTKIYSLEKIASSARSLMDNERLPLLVSSMAEGKLKISGTLSSADPWIRMRQTLLREVPGISGIEDGVEITAPRPPAVQAAIATIQTAVVPETAAMTPPKPVIYQPPTPDPQTDYVITQDTIDTVEATVATIRPDDATGLAYVRLSTGGVYFSGARLPYGGTVDRIESGTVTVVEKGVTRVLHQGDAATKARNTTSTQP